MVYNFHSENGESGNETSSTISFETNRIRKYEVNSQPKEAFLPEESKDPEMKLLDLYCGCRAMSTGLCLGGNLSGMNLVTVSSLLVLIKSNSLNKLCFVCVYFDTVLFQ